MPANIGAELQSLPLGYMLGAPLKAAIEGQALAAKTTIDFIQKVGLEEDESGNLKVRATDFEFVQVVPDPATPGAFQEIDAKLTVPILSIVPIPYIRISDLNVTFEFKIRDISSAQTKAEITSKFGIENTTEAKAKFGGGLLGFFGAPSGEMKTRTHIEMSVSASYQRQERHTTDRSATLKVTMNAVQDAIPEGLARVLTILNDTIKAQKK